MCRLFAFRSVIPSQVHRSLIAAENALGTQSEEHPDGWGVAHYVDGTPHLTRAPSTALNDAIFHRLSGVVASETVLAHIRKATVGPKTVLNCHPFQYGRWVFAHNGDIRDFGEWRSQLVAEIAPRLRRYILGDTDSEVLFFVLLTQLARHAPLSARIGIEELCEAIRATDAVVRAIADQSADEPSLLTFIVTDGVTMAASQGGKELFWSTHKRRCPDRDHCPHLAAECEAPSGTGFVNHLIFSSEVMSGENVWQPLGPGEIVGVDWRMRITRSSTQKRALPLQA